jgi:nucleotide-binding universal stress UspA family protein
MKIIVGFDFSNSSENAVGHAIVWAKKHSAEIVLVNCFMPTIVDPNIPVGSIDMLQMETIKELNEKLGSKAREIQEKGVPTTFKVVVGDVKFGILATIKEEHAELLILGKTLNPNFLDRVIGSNAQHLLNSLPIPLLVIPEDTKVGDLNVISYATEREFAEQDILDDVKEIAQKFKAEIHIFKVNISTLDDAFKNLNANESKEKVEEISAENLREGFDKFNEKVGANLLVLTSHKRGVLDGLLAPSKSKVLIPRIKIPVLIYHFS